MLRGLHIGWFLGMFSPLGAEEFFLGRGVFVMFINTIKVS